MIDEDEPISTMNRLEGSTERSSAGAGRLALFAHFDEGNRVKPYIVDHLAKLKEHCSRIVFISTSALPEREMERVRPFVTEVLLKENVGYDFGMWRHALERISWGHFDEIVLTNSSVFGPVWPLGPIFERMSQTPCDFWGMTDTREGAWHLQSYFLVLRRRLIESPQFTAFWQGVLPFRRKGAVVLSYEIGLTAYFEDYGFRPAVFASVDSWAPPAIRRHMELTRNFNPTLFYPLELLRAGMPFVKVELLKNNLADLDLGAVRAAMRVAGYDLSLVEFDPRPQIATSWPRIARRVIPTAIVDTLRALLDKISI